MRGDSALLGVSRLNFLCSFTSFEKISLAITYRCGKQGRLNYIVLFWVGFDCYTG